MTKGTHDRLIVAGFATCYVSVLAAMFLVNSIVADFAGFAIRFLFVPAFLIGAVLMVVASVAARRHGDH